jgi:hypothetical protein
MPEISRFLGIIISMYFDEHNPPHFHIRYNENKENFARFYLDSWPTLAWECGFDISPESLYSMLGKRAARVR